MAARRGPQHAQSLATATLALILTACANDFGQVVGHPDCDPVPVAFGNVALKGIEDLEATSFDARDNPYIILSATERRAWIDAEGEPCNEERDAAADGVFVIRLQEVMDALGKPDATVKAVRLVESTAVAHPHGINLRKTADGFRLFVVDHPSRCEPKSEKEIDYGTRIVVGDLKVRANELTFADPDMMIDVVETADHERLCSGNDIAALDRKRFVLSHDSGHCDDFSDNVDIILNRAAQKLLYYDGGSFHAVADGFGYINGVAVSPDGATIWAADTRRPNLRKFDATTFAELPVDVSLPAGIPAGLDNLAWGADGLFYSAAHPDPVRFALYGKLAPRLVTTSPTAIVQINPNDMKHRLLAKDDGKNFSAASATIRIGNLLISGAVFDAGLFVCKLDETARGTLS